MTHLQGPPLNLEEVVNSIEGSLTEYAGFRITAEKEIEAPKPVVSIGNADFACPGNISVISAAAKAGKTAFTNAIIAGALHKGEPNFEPLNELHVVPAQGKAVIQFDTEQSEFDQQRNVKSVLKRIDEPNTPENYFSYNIRTLAFSEYKTTTEEILRLANKEFGGIHLIVIDGGADFVTSVNEDKECKEIISFFTSLSVKYNCPVIVIIHTNPGSEKERGHFGSELQRKCYGLISITKQGDISTAQAKIMRRATLSETPLISFSYSPIQGYHISVENAMSEVFDKDQLKRIKLTEAAKNALPIGTSKKYADLLNAIMAETNKGTRTAKDYVRDLTGWGVIEQGEDGYYRLVQGAKWCKIAPI